MSLRKWLPLALLLGLPLFTMPQLAPGFGVTAAVAADQIDLNTATVDELQALPGIGPAKAKAIVEGRPYASLSAFEAKGIVPASVFDKFKGVTEVTGSKATAASGQGTPGQIAAQKRIRMCGSKWRAAKAADRIPAGMSWPQFWSQCNTALKERGY